MVFRTGKSIGAVSSQLSQIKLVYTASNQLFVLFGNNLTRINLAPSTHRAPHVPTLVAALHGGARITSSTFTNIGKASAS